MEPLMTEATESKGYSQTLEDYLSNRHRPDAHLALIFFFGFTSMPFSLRSSSALSAEQFIVW